MVREITKIFSQQIDRFIRAEASSSIVLGFCTLAAIILANSSYSADYYRILDYQFLHLNLHHWVNDVLMTIFFFVVGMEIKREIVAGELSIVRNALLPIVAAIGGMIAPALIYFLFNPHLPEAKGWAIPVATDIAFAVGVLTLLGNRIPRSLKIFLLALAIADDIGAIVVIALFYTGQIQFWGLIIAILSVLAILTALKFQIHRLPIYFLLALGVWFGVFWSGIHATIAGVVLGFLVPHILATEKKDAIAVSPITELTSRLHNWVSFGIMPVFALVNAGVSLNYFGLSSFFQSSIAKGVFLGLALGKPIGILVACYFVFSVGFASLPRDLKWRHLLGVSCLAGIGFTMSIFITTLSLAPDAANFAKLGVLLASSFSAVLGFLILLWAKS